MDDRHPRSGTVQTALGTRWSVVGGRHSVVGGRWTVDGGRWTVDDRVPAVGFRAAGARRSAHGSRRTTPGGRTPGNSPGRRTTLGCGRSAVGARQVGGGMKRFRVGSDRARWTRGSRGRAGR
ncbi:hypothetical protein E1295_28580 [Nonomuraea mesophila]|uniref:Uncharacterized protein n=1 Tax=Nonomuraea mesophila TaxID=2530382 RepID=A0A4R5F484_9ACTN|nr:hypothetical protein E1295_28580 [Nonomuraea mesophila]